MGELANKINELVPKDFLTNIDFVAVGIALVIFFVFLFLRKVVSGYIFKFFMRITSKAKTNLAEYIVRSFQKPVETGLVFFGLYAALNYLKLGITTTFAYQAFFRSIVVVLVSWGFVSLVRDHIVLSEELHKLNFKIDPNLISFLAKVAKVIIYVLALLTIAQEWGYDVNSFLTGLGLGGLAIALAAQDTVANVFGGVIIITDKPFSIGDWIQTSEIEGTVEDITFRSTKIRTFADAVTTVPNSTLANASITNWSRIGKRRINFNLRVTYSTPRDKLQKCLERIKDMLSTHPEIDKDVIFVNFNEFNDSSLDIFLYFFTKTTNWGRYLDVREDVNLKIMAILEEEGIEVAFPTRSVYIEKDSDEERM